MLIRTKLYIFNPCEHFTVNGPIKSWPTIPQGLSYPLQGVPLSRQQSLRWLFYCFYKTVRIKGINQLFHNRGVYDTHVFIIPKKMVFLFFDIICQISGGVFSSGPSVQKRQRRSAQIQEPMDVLLEIPSKLFGHWGISVLF